MAGAVDGFVDPYLRHRLVYLSMILCTQPLGQEG